MGNQFQPERKPGNPALHPPLYEGISLSVMGLANSVVVCLRRDFGARTMHPVTFAGPLAFHLGLGWLSYQATNVPFYVHQSGVVMMIFALMMGWLASYYERRGRALAFRNPSVHTMSRGISLLWPLFRVLRIRHSTLQGGIEPVLVVCLGVYLISTLQWYLLGWWLVASGFSLAYVEAVVAAHTANALLDLRDSHAEAEFLMATERTVHSAATPAKGRRGKADSVDVATLAPELERLKPGQTTITRKRGS